MENSHSHGRVKNSVSTQILVILLIILSVLLIGAIAMKIFLVHPAARDIKSKQYQALFLTNGQVYFGKITGLDNNYVKITDIYYLQTQPAQPSSSSSSSTQSQQTLTLAKLGNELHGPEDAMYVAKSQILFWENLKDDGKVVQAIKQSQSKK